MRIGFIKEMKLHFLIIAGDITSDYKYTLRVIDELNENTKTKVMFVPGNHDVWMLNQESLTTFTRTRKN